ncbi:MAG TPA: NAD(P)-dependent oxidoreductase [Candidatus Binataceae bacterium]|nr:NAD(P)-dependent oxidoreductase [Candidatus Binataceae bacterium]
MATILITGAAGNLGSRLARRLLNTGDRLRLMVHRKPVPADLANAANVEIAPADLARPQTIAQAVAGADCIVHFAGVLFRPRPERFLPETNVRWFGNLVDAAIAAGVGRIILVSFPHVEGPTTPENPATDRLDRQPISAHARTRLEAERLLFARTQGTRTTPVVIRAATVYGRGILMVEAARKLARLRLLGVWRQPTWYHFIHIDDFLDAVATAISKPGIEGIYPVGDEQPITIQQFLDGATEVWGVPRPWRMPWWMIYTAAASCEAFATLFGTFSPLTRDFVRLGRVDHCCDTKRMRAELLPTLAWPTFEAGKATLR